MINKEKINEITKRIESLKNLIDNSTPIPDGIVDLEKYNNSPIKLLWILKEVNSENDTDEWDLRDALKDLKTKDGMKKGWKKTYLPVIYTSYGIIHNIKWDDSDSIYKNPDMVDTLKEIAVVNVKKFPGKSVANLEQLQKSYKQQKEILKEQIEVYKPDIIVCGGTFDIIKNDIIKGENDLQVIKEEPFSAYKQNKRIIIDAYHPAQHTITQEKYCDTILYLANVFLNRKN